MNQPTDFLVIPDTDEIEQLNRVRPMFEPTWIGTKKGVVVSGTDDSGHWTNPPRPS